MRADMSNGARAFARLMASPGVTGLVVMVVGLAPLLAGVFNVCLIAPVIRVPFSGRSAQERQR
jgi:hypothetical protein